MATAVAVLSSFGSDQWDAETYAVLSLAARLSSLVKTRSQAIRLAYQMWRLNSMLAGFFEAVSNVFEGRVSPSTTPVTPEQIEDSIRTLRKMHAALETLYEAAKRSQLTNHSLIAMPLRSMHTYSDEILELAELLELCQAPEQVQAIFDRSSKEREQGDIYDLAQIE